MNDGLGLWLRRTRENEHLSLADVEKALRIRRRYLQALEVGDYNALPGEIQARGFLRNYARFLHLPVEEALARYDAEIQGHPVQPRARPVTVESKAGVISRPTVFSPPPSEAEEVAQVSSGIPRGIFIVLLGAVGFFVAIVIVTFVLLRFVQPDAGATPVSTLEAETAVIATDTGTMAGTALPDTVDGKVRIRLVPKEHAWVSLSADDSVVFQGIATPENVLEAAAGEMIIVATGNGGAFQLFINGTEMGDLGAAGEVIRRAWTPEGEISLEDG